MQRALRCAAVVCGLTGFTGQVRAQQPVYFLPGLNEGGGVWSAAASFLQGNFNILAQPIDLPTNSPYETQASFLGTLPTTSALVGHSNGGIVARVKAQTAPVDAVVTYGSPNYGAPLEETFPLMTTYLSRTTFDILLTFETQAPSFDWVLDDLADDEAWAVPLLAGAMDVVVDALGYLGGEVSNEMGPNSQFMSQELNSQAHIQAETANTRTETSVVFITDDYFNNGFYKLLSPSNGNTVGNVMDEFEVAMAADAAYIVLNADPEDVQAQTLADRLLTAADDLNNLDWAWCVTLSQSLLCEENDEVLPGDRQDLARGVIATVVRNSPVVHTTETDDAGGVLPGVFDKIGLARR
jgi:pimeloyl-ACP methyl ester carboxylesterase